MTTYEQALAAFKRSEIELPSLVDVACSELRQRPSRRALVTSEVAKACAARGMNELDTQRALSAFEEDAHAVSTAVDVHLARHEDRAQNMDDATVFAPSSAGNAGAGGGAVRVSTETPAGNDDRTELAQVSEVDGATTHLEADPHGSKPSPAPIGTGVEEPAIQVTERTVSLQPGDVLIDRFELEEAIGEGGMGVIFRAKDREQLRFTRREPYVAIKVLGDRFSRHPDSLMALHREADKTKKLRHDNIVRVDDFTHDQKTGHHFMVMEYLRGETLTSFVKRQRGQNLSMDTVWHICESTGKALAYAHQRGIIHSDVKPSNIWITEANEIKVLDFGIARAVEPDTQTIFSEIEGATPAYGSPEQLQGMPPDERDDTYALACVTYELIAGHHPYFKKNAIDAKKKNLPLQRPPGVSTRQWRALKAALALDTDQRTSNIDAFLEEFAPQRRRPLRIVTLLLAVLSMGAAGVMLVNRDWSPSTPVTGPMTPDQIYLNDLLATKASHPLSPEDLEDFLDEGQLYAAWGREDLMSGEYHGGNSQLKNGVSNAVRPYYMVLEGTKDAELRQAAAEGILAVDQTYVEVIDILAEMGTNKKALWLTCQALAQTPGTRVPLWPPLQTRYESLWRDVVGGPLLPHASGCGPDYIHEDWGNPLPTRSPVLRAFEP